MLIISSAISTHPVIISIMIFIHPGLLKKIYDEVIYFSLPKGNTILELCQ